MLVVSSIFDSQLWDGSNLFYFILDIDECSADSSPCDENADCSNNDGSYSCLCKQGFSGDGKTCQGIVVVFFLQFLDLCHQN